MSLTSFILAACITQARRFSSDCGLLDQPSAVAIGMKLTTWISHELFVINKVQEYHYR